MRLSSKTINQITLHCHLNMQMLLIKYCNSFDATFLLIFVNKPFAIFWKEFFLGDIFWRLIYPHTTWHWLNPIWVPITESVRPSVLTFILFQEKIDFHKKCRHLTKTSRRSKNREDLNTFRKDISCISSHKKIIAIHCNFKPFKGQQRLD